MEQTANQNRESKSFLFAIVSTLLVAAIIVTLIVLPQRYDSISKAWYDLNGGLVEYPYVFVHGLGGWGENSTKMSLSYWSASGQAVPEYLRSKGYTVAAPSVGPFSSTWDRACELYAQLTGTRVDYGAAHSKACGHARYGRTYTEPMIENWGQKVNGGQRVKINFISHSFGGATVRQLCSLLAYGDKAEKSATGRKTSPLFTGGKADWVNSITTLCSPNNGSTLTCIVDDIGSVAGVDNSTELIENFLFKYAKETNSANGLTDLMLDQFGIDSKTGSDVEITEAIRAIESAGDDNAFYDLSPDGAAAVNSRIKTVNGVYYFSYAFDTTQKATLINGSVPKANTFLLFYPLAAAMGTYTGTTEGGIIIDESWQANDGLVPVCSARYPANDPHCELPAEVKDVMPGIWNMTPVREGNHATPCGFGMSVAEMHSFYDEICGRISELRRS